MGTSAYLVDPTELAELIVLPEPPTVLDTRWRLGVQSRRPDYRQGHIPGSVFVEMDGELSAAADDGSRGRHPLPEPAAFEAAMRRAGVSQARPVVVYDDRDSTAAGRAWWLLRYFGHPAVRVLDGGYAAWLEAGLPVEEGDPPPPTTGDFVAVPGGMPVVDAAGAAALAGEGILLDARAVERYRGEVEPVDRAAGHIPGARSIPTGGNVGEDGRFRAAAELRARFEEAGVRAGRAAGAYCGSGITAAHEVLALSIAGFEDVALYPGSWSEWVADPARPVEIGGGRPGDT